MKQFILFSVFFLLLFSCNTENVHNKDACEILSQYPEDSLLTMSGKIIISPKGEFIFDTKSKAGSLHNSFRKIQLQPCEKITDKFIKEMYDKYLYQINSDSDFWVQITGKYITPLSSEETPLFAVNFLVLISKNEVE